MHEEFDNLAALEAIGAASDDESMQLAQHLETCAECRASLAEYGESASALALGLEPVTPPAHVRDAILAEVDAEVEEVEEEQQRHLMPAWWFAAAAVFFLGLFAWSELRLRALREELSTVHAEKAELASQNMRLSEDVALLRERFDTVRSSAQVVRLAGQQAAPTASAAVFMDREHHRAVIFFSNLAPNDPTKSYQLWILRSDKPAPESAGVFDVGADGRGELMMKDMPPDIPLAGLAVTLEPHGGLPAPSGAILLQGKA